MIISDFIGGEYEKNAWLQLRFDLDQKTSGCLNWLAARCCNYQGTARARGSPGWQDKASWPPVQARSGAAPAWVLGTSVGVGMLGQGQDISPWANVGAGSVGPRSGTDMAWPYWDWSSAFL